MSTQIGRFEVVSEIAKSDRGAVYKANDPTNGQTVALKILKLDLPPQQLKALVDRIVAEADSTKSLASPNIALLYGAGEIADLFCATMEYVQGNSIATMLARKEGFSIWDLLDISRQVCQGLDHAHSRGVVHYSLEPAKVMVQWDGTVKILGFGISTMRTIESGPSGTVSTILHYASPEQVKGEALDARSNFFTWGAILYEMVTDQKAFDGADAETISQKIVEETPVPPVQINRKIHPAVSDLIMKAISKSPEERFQNGQELIDGLEKCKQASTQPAKKSSTPPQGITVPKPASASATAKTAGPSAAASAKPAATKAAEVKPLAAPAVAKAPAIKPALTPAAAKVSPAGPAASKSTAPARPAAPVPEPAPTSAYSAPTLEPGLQKFEINPKPAPAKAAAAAAGAGLGSTPDAASRTPHLDPSAQFISSCVKASVDALEKEEAKMSAAAAEELEVETPAPPKFAVDPMMAEDGPASRKQASFSELEELPPLKEAYVEPAPPPPAASETAEETPAPVFLSKREPEKSKIQPREVAQKAVKEIKSVPPKLIIYSVSGALGLILLIVALLAYRIHSENAEEVGTPAPAASAPAQPEPVKPQTPAPAPVQVAVPAPEEIPAAPPVKVAPVVKSRSAKRKAAPVRATLAVVPGQLAIDSTPQGAQVQVDGRSDPSWVTPYNLAGLTPGQHTVSVNKAGFTSETRTVDVTSGSKSFLVIHLAQMAASVSLTSDPAGASIFINGKDTGRVTPTQITVEKGTHSFLIRKQGYLDETTTADLQPGQTFHFSPTLRSLGNADEIKNVSKAKKFFGGNGIPAGMGVVSIKTQPRGAQIAVNQRMLEKASPTEFAIGPGNYLLDITLSGYKPIHRVINVDKGNKVALDEVMERE
jgi:serine/threonine protein kinase